MYTTSGHLLIADENKDTVADDMYTGDNTIPSLYSWRIRGYTECSTSCGEGGFFFLIFPNCKNMKNTWHDKRWIHVASMYCSGVLFSVLLALWSPRLGKRELVYVLLLHLFVYFALIFVFFFFLLVSVVGCGLWLWHSLDFYIIIWTTSCENVSYAICEQQRYRSACASAQSDQHLCCSLPR